jgi:medium-chain acyl-[acyl-carrier-protein] hydrolase
MMKAPGAWFPNGDARGRVELKLFCFPYAGGTASIFRDWANHLPSTIQVIPVDLPGRGRRFTEPPFIGYQALLEALAEAMPPLLDTPFAFFGHSMGAIIAFELARYLRREYGRVAREREEALVTQWLHEHWPRIKKRPGGGKH